MHTKEPWSVVEVDNSSDMQVTPSHCIISGDTYIAAMESDSDVNARRIVACVNACAGVPIEVLEMVPPEEPYSLVKQQRDELLAALRELTIRAENEIADPCDVPEIVNANAVLAKADLTQ